jgi:hypothetical protein
LRQARSVLHQPEDPDIELLLFLGEVDTLGVVLGAARRKLPLAWREQPDIRLHEEPELVGR